MNKIEHTPKLTISQRDPNAVLCDGTHMCWVQWGCIANANSEINAHWANTIVRACNEHAALVAVAKAANQFVNGHDASHHAKWFLASSDQNAGNDNWSQFIEEIRPIAAALAALAQIRGGAK